MLDTLVSWLIRLSDSPVRAFRHTSSLAGKTTCFLFLLGHLHVPGDIANNDYANFGGTVGGKQDVLWDLRK